MTNDQIPPVKTIAEWRVLPETAFSTLKTADQRGSDFTVYEVAILGASKADCDGIDVSKAFLAGEKHVLSMTVVNFDGTRQFCKVLLELGRWAIDTDSHAKALGARFPMQIEVSRLNGRAYVEVL